LLSIQRQVIQEVKLFLGYCVAETSFLLTNFTAKKSSHGSLALEVQLWVHKGSTYPVV